MRQRTGTFSSFQESLTSHCLSICSGTHSCQFETPSKVKGCLCSLWRLGMVHDSNFSSWNALRGLYTFQLWLKAPALCKGLWYKKKKTIVCLLQGRVSEGDNVFPRKYMKKFESRKESMELLVVGMSLSPWYSVTQDVIENKVISLRKEESGCSSFVSLQKKLYLFVFSMNYKLNEYKIQISGFILHG